MEVWENRNLEDLDGEIWKEISGYNGDYFVSNLGRVKSFKRYHGTDIRILKLSKDGCGYLTVKLSKNGKRKTRTIHNLMFESFTRKLLPNEVVHHTDENKENNINNLEAMDKGEHSSFHNKGKTCSELSEKMKGENNPMFGKHHSWNTIELIREKTKGENHPKSILTENNIIKIIKLCREGTLTQTEIGKLFVVNRRTISSIKTGKNWKHIKRGDYNDS